MTKSETQIYLLIFLQKERNQFNWMGLVGDGDGTLIYGEDNKQSPHHLQKVLFLLI
jgi:hypothetical protein